MSLEQWHVQGRCRLLGLLAVVQMKVVDPLGQGHKFVHVLLAGPFPWICGHSEGRAGFCDVLKCTAISLTHSHFDYFVES